MHLNGYALSGIFPRSRTSRSRMLLGLAAVPGARGPCVILRQVIAAALHALAVGIGAAPIAIALRLDGPLTAALAVAAGWSSGSG